MTHEELLQQVASEPTPTLRRRERYEDDQQFVGFVLGEATDAPAPVAVALEKALGIVRCCGDSCGCACDSNCSCR